LEGLRRRALITGLDPHRFERSARGGILAANAGVRPSRWETPFEPDPGHAGV